MNRQKALIGTLLDSSIRTIEGSQVRLLENTMRPSYSAAEQGQAEIKKGYLYHYPTFLFGNLINTDKIYQVLGLNINNVLLSRESVVSHGTASANDKLTVRTFLRDAYEQQASSNPIGFIILESLGSIGNEVIFYCERVIAVRGGFQRGRST